MPLSRRGDAGAEKQRGDPKAGPDCRQPSMDCRRDTMTSTPSLWIVVTGRFHSARNLAATASPSSSAPVTSNADTSWAGTATPQWTALIAFASMRSAPP